MLSNMIGLNVVSLFYLSYLSPFIISANGSRIFIYGSGREYTVVINVID